MDQSRWPEMKERFAAVFASATRDEWVARFEGRDACVAPVLSPAEAPAHPHNRARGAFVEVAGVLQPAPAPRFSRTPASVRRPPGPPGADTETALAAWGIDPARLGAMRAAGALA
jgi:alpha-methylacyl-CoA racemase